MEDSERFWAASPEEMAAGIVREGEEWICLLCGEKRTEGRIYRVGEDYFDARAALNEHIAREHGSVFDTLIDLDKKLTGLTEHQRQILRLFKLGWSDEEIQKHMGIGSASTIRNHRFQLKQRERQAKVTLALMQAIPRGEKAAQAEPIAPTARFVDERYDVTHAERKQILKKYMAGGVLAHFAMQEKHKIVLLTEIVKRFEAGTEYNEKQVTAKLAEIFPDDPAVLRRYLIEYGMMQRVPDGSRYWRL